MFYTIYRIINITNNKQYIGKHQTNDIDDGYMGSGKLLRKAISKHGLQNFIKEILYVFETEEEMNAKEAELVTEAFCIREDTYNICVGGQGGFGYINNNETLRIEKNKKARKTTNDRYSEKLSDWGRMGAKAAFENNNSKKAISLLKDDSLTHNSKEKREKLLKEGYSHIEIPAMHQEIELL